MKYYNFGRLQGSQMCWIRLPPLDSWRPVAMDTASWVCSTPLPSEGPVSVPRVWVPGSIWITQKMQKSSTSTPSAAARSNRGCSKRSASRLMKFFYTRFILNAPRFNDFFIMYDISDVFVLPTEFCNFQHSWFIIKTWSFFITWISLFDEDLKICCSSHKHSSTSGDVVKLWMMLMDGWAHIPGAEGGCRDEAMPRLPVWSCFQIQSNWTQISSSGDHKKVSRSSSM